jgi:F-type H+-transporting ATPase subunit b
MRAVCGGLLLAATPPLLAAEGEPNIFAGGIGNAIITLIIFVGVVLILGKYAWPPLMRVLSEREEAIRKSLEDAKREREDAETLLAEYKAQMDKAHDEAAALIADGRRAAEEVRRGIHEEARGEAERMIQRATREIQLATDAAIKELYDQTAELAVKVAAGVVQKELSADDHRRLVAESLEQMKSANEAGLN